MVCAPFSTNSFTNNENDEISNQHQHEGVEDQIDRIEEADDNIDHVPLRGYRSLAEVYGRCNLAVLEPTNCFEALQSEVWKSAMEEISMIEKNQTWTLVDEPRNKKILGVKWVFRTKLKADGSTDKYKARLVVKGYAQESGIDLSDTFAPVARLDTVKLLLAIAAHKGWPVFQLNVKSAFLNGFLD